MGSVKYKAYGLILLAVIAVFVLTCLGGYEGWFTSSVPLQLRADRGGLQMYPGNRVLLRGVDVGRVGDVRMAPDGNGVDITLKMKPDMIDKVPANVNVSLDQLTAFGAKTVTLSIPPGDRAPSVRPGATLASGRVTVEVNNVFDQLTRVLTDAQPAKVNAVLGGLAEALHGRGDKIGQTVSDVDTYLTKFNTDLPTLRTDFHKGADVANLYADVTPDLATLLANGTVTANTVVDQRHELAQTLHEVERVADVGTDFLAENGDNIIGVAANLRPTTSLLRKYSPEFTCFLQGLAISNKQLITSQGNTVPGLVGITTIVPGSDPYRYPRDLPNMNAHDGPSCHGLPNWDGKQTPPGLDRNFSHGDPRDNRGDNTPRLGDPPLVAQLFGGSAVESRNGAQEKRAAEDKQRRIDPRGEGGPR